ncbi:HlyC/CorC family transporter [Lachnospiraceae bacterium MD308]|nr:HlyC/CorC family transporter [Lachnospiraceae bacterium MD308]MCI8581330.1 HlyC/CorC family transporter [Dorea sp.]
MEEGSLFQKIRQIFQAEDEMDDGLKKEAAALIRNIFRYMDKDAKDIMTHRKNIIAIDGKETLEDALKFMLDENFSRFPIYKEDIDEIVGFLHLRDAMECYLAREQRKIPVSELGDYIRAVTFIPETKSIDTLFREMQVSHNHVVIVLDEYGQTSGLVTMEDILEELVGNILDEHDVEEKMITRLVTGNYLVNGFAELEDLEDYLGIQFDKENYGTLNGFLIDQLERIPSQDEHCVVEYEGYRFTVLLVDNNTIRRVKIEKLPE